MENVLEESLSRPDLIERGFRNSGNVYYKIVPGRRIGEEAVNIDITYREVARGIYALESTSYRTKTNVEMF